MKPAVSIILPTRNREAVLRNSIDSIRSQDFEDWELIITDDGSTDATKFLIDSYRDPRFVYLFNERAAGAAHARNQGLARARGELIAFQDSGDEWLPGKLRAQVELMGRLPPQVGLVYGKIELVYLDGAVAPDRIPILTADDEDTHRRALALGVFGIDPPTWMVRASVFAAYGGFDESLRQWEDIEFMMRLSKSFRFQHMDRIVARCYERTEGVSKNPDTLVAAHRYIMKKYAGELSPGMLAEHYRCVGRRLLPSPHAALGRSLLWKAAMSGHGRLGDFAWLALGAGGRPAFGLARRAAALGRRWHYGVHQKDGRC